MKTKFLLTTVIIFFVAFTANAQINKGAWLLGGGLSYYSNKSVQPSYYYANSQNKSVGANIQIGKAVNKNDVAGLIFSYNYYKVNAADYPDSNAYKNNQYGAGVFYRMYKKLLKDFYFFGEIDGEYTHSENSQENLQNGTDYSKTTSDGGRMSFVPGLSYQLCKMMQVELTMQNIVSASYVHFKTNYNNITIPPGPYKGNNFSFNANLNSGFLSNFGIGFKFLLGK